MSPNAIQLTWDPPEDSGESIQSYELYYNDSHFRQNVRITISPPRNTYLLEDLTPNTVYHIRVAAKSTRGEGASTPTIQERTLEYGKSYQEAFLNLSLSNDVKKKLTSMNRERSFPNKLNNQLMYINDATKIVQLCSSDG